MLARGTRHSRSKPPTPPLSSNYRNLDPPIVRTISKWTVRLLIHFSTRGQKDATYRIRIRHCRLQSLYIIHRSIRRGPLRPGEPSQVWITACIKTSGDFHDSFYVGAAWNHLFSYVNKFDILLLAFAFLKRKAAANGTHCRWFVSRSFGDFVWRKFFFYGFEDSRIQPVVDEYIHHSLRWSILCTVMYCFW